MSIIIDENTRLLIQGITGREGSFHARSCIEYGSKVVAGVTPGKGGTKMDAVPVFDTVERAVKETGANASMIFVPGAFAAEAMLEAIDAGVSVVACIADGVPTLDMVVVKKYLQGKTTRLIGPNCPGLISPGKCKMGIMPSPIHLPGNVGVVSRSGTLTFETVSQLTEQGVGQSTCVGIGGDPIVGTSFIDVLTMFQADPDTKAVVVIGEIGGTAEQEAAEFVKTKMTKPVVGFIAGQTAPPGKRMGHAGAIISGSSGTAAEKIAAFEAAGIPAVKTPAEIGLTMARVLKERGL